MQPGHRPQRRPQDQAVGGGGGGGVAAAGAPPRDADAEPHHGGGAGAPPRLLPLPLLHRDDVPPLPPPLPPLPPPPIHEAFPIRTSLAKTHPRTGQQSCRSFVQADDAITMGTSSGVTMGRASLWVGPEEARSTCVRSNSRDFLITATPDGSAPANTLRVYALRCPAGNVTLSFNDRAPGNASYSMCVTPCDCPGMTQIVALAKGPKDRIEPAHAYPIWHMVPFCGKWRNPQRCAVSSFF